MLFLPALYAWVSPGNRRRIGVEQGGETVGAARFNQWSFCQNHGGLIKNPVKCLVEVGEPLTKAA
jgi:hypothetical protein